MSDPIALPLLPWQEVEFSLVRPANIARMEGRFTEVDAFGTPYWTLRLSSVWLQEREAATFDAFAARTAAGQRTFLGHDVFRPRPIEHDAGVPLSGTKAGGGAFNGTAALVAISNSRQISVNGLPANWQLRQGDYVELRMSALKRCVVMIDADAIGSAGGLVSLTLSTPIDTSNFDLSAVVNFEKPSTVMLVDPGSCRLTKSWSSRQASFSATEVFFS